MGILAPELTWARAACSSTVKNAFTLPSTDLSCCRYVCVTSTADCCLLATVC